MLNTNQEKISNFTLVRFKIYFKNDRKWPRFMKYMVLKNYGPILAKTTNFGENSNTTYGDPPNRFATESLAKLMHEILAKIKF